MCHQPPPPPPSSIFFASSLHSLQHCLPDTSGLTRSRRVIVDVCTSGHTQLNRPRVVCVRERYCQAPAPLSLTGIKNNSRCSGNAALPHSTAEGRCGARMSHQCAPVGHTNRSTPCLNLTGFISFSLKQKMIASQQAFSSKPSH